jgi:hypothetical protein
VVVKRDFETQWLVGEVVELPVCYTQAPDLPALEASMREAIRAYYTLLSSSRANRSPTLWAPGVLRSRLEQTSPGLMKIGDIGVVFLKQNSSFCSSGRAFLVCQSARNGPLEGNKNRISFHSQPNRILITPDFASFPTENYGRSGSNGMDTTLLPT